jgi:hypothetical protein
VNRNAGVKTTFETWVKPRDYGYDVRIRMTQYELHPTRGYKKCGRRNRYQWVKKLPKSIHQGYRKIDEIIMGRNVRFPS